MAESVHSCVVEANWKLKTILRTRRFFNDEELIGVYKSHILSFIEYRTPGIFHASSSILQSLDHVQERFLADICISDVDAVSHFRLAPLRSRRDIAILGFIHRALLLEGPVVFHSIFARDEGAQPRASNRLNVSTSNTCFRCLESILPFDAPDYAQRSALGMIRIYNLLPGRIRSITEVPSFQGALQELLTSAAQAGIPFWDRLFCCRLPRNNHPLRLVQRG